MDADEASSISFPDSDPALVRFRDESRFWIQRVLMPIIGTIGIFGNIVTIVVLTRRGMRTSTNSYLTALAVADLIYLICVLWLSLRHYPNYNEDPIWSYIYSHVWPYSLWLADATTNTSVWLTVTFTVERCIAIAYPIKGRLLCTISRAKKVIFGVYLICFTTTMTTPFEWTVEEKANLTSNTSTFEIASSNLGKMKIYHTIFYWFTSITFVLLPLMLLIIFNSFLVHSFRQSQKLRRIMTAKQKLSEREERAAALEIKITITLITVVIIFIFCQLPTAATLIYKIFHSPKFTSNEEAVLRALGNIFNFLVSLNSACNFILYCALSDKYRPTFMLTFFSCFYRPSRLVHSKAIFSYPKVGRIDGAKFTSRRIYSASSRINPTVIPLRTWVSQRHTSKLQCTPTAPVPTRRKENCYIIALPSISGITKIKFSTIEKKHDLKSFYAFSHILENGSSSDIFASNCHSQPVVIQQHQYSSSITGTKCNSHRQLRKKRSPMRRKTTNARKKTFIGTSYLLSIKSLPNMLPCYRPTYCVSTSLDNARRIRFNRVSKKLTHEFPVASCSV